MSAWPTASSKCSTALGAPALSGECGGEPASALRGDGSRPRRARSAAGSRGRAQGTGASAPAPTISSRLRVWRSEVAGGERRSGGGAPQRQPRAVERRQRRAGDARLQRIKPMHRRQAARAIAGKDIDDLGADEILRAAETRPGRHQEHRRRRFARPLDCMVSCARARGSRRERPRRARRSAKGNPARRRCRRRRNGAWRLAAPLSAAARRADGRGVASASARQRSASARLRRSPRRCLPCASQAAAPPASTPTIPARISTMNSGASSAKAGTSPEGKGSNETVTNCRLAKANSSNRIAIGAMMMNLRKRSHGAIRRVASGASSPAAWR